MLSTPPLSLAVSALFPRCVIPSPALCPRKERRYSLCLRAHCTIGNYEVIRRIGAIAIRVFYVFLLPPLHICEPFPRGYNTRRRGEMQGGVRQDFPDVSDVRVGRGLQDYRGNLDRVFAILHARARTYTYACTRALALAPPAARSLPTPLSLSSVCSILARTVTHPPSSSSFSPM